jgi:hypothetical protein
MNRPPRNHARWVLIALTAAAIIHLAGLYLLSHFDLFERVLAASNFLDLGFVAVVVVFFSLRLFLIILGPGLAVVALGLMMVRGNSGEPSS